MNKRYLFKYTDNDTKRSYNAIIEASDKESAYHYWQNHYLSENRVVDNIIEL